MRFPAGLWVADSHAWGRGKVHIIKATDPQKTYCGNRIQVTPGKPVEDGEVTCIGCRRAELAEQERQNESAAYQRQRDEYDAKRQLEQEEWWAEYNAYLQTTAWREKSAAVLNRAGGICEGCGNNRATMAHHLTYDHVGHRYPGGEFLWELRAVCSTCHERVHPRSIDEEDESDGLDHIRDILSR